MYSDEPSLLVNSDGSRQLVLVKFGKHFGLSLAKNYRFYRLYLDKT